VPHTETLNRMEFVLSRILQTFVLPPGCLVILMMSGIILQRRGHSIGRVLVTSGVVLLYLLSLPLSADLLIRPLERYSQPLQDVLVKADAVVVLGGGVRDLSWIPAPPAPSDAAFSRLVAGIQLVRSLKIPLVLSGGSGSIAPGLVREADAMREIAVRMGIPADWIRTDAVSRNTWENAKETRKILGNDTIILVTSAFHMKRAAGLFRKQGFTVIPAPVSYQAETRTRSFADLLPRAAYLDTSSLALSEYISYFWYRLLGRI
jgi:uncharacterized SAM-binding protein YcdF (DUF218 family)